jgi:multidrug efflux pump subunit AcrA (membrane-fusion protein)
LIKAASGSLDLSGALSFTANTTVSSEVAAQVRSIEVADGQPIGQLLLVFDKRKSRNCKSATANLQKDEATLTYNKIEWKKTSDFTRAAQSATQYVSRS